MGAESHTADRHGIAPLVRAEMPWLQARGNEMNLIWKEKLPTTSGARSMLVPKHARILSVQAQREEISIWFEFSEADREDLTPRFFATIETGEPFRTPSGKRLEFLDTVQLAGGYYVLHIYELKDF